MSKSHIKKRQNSLKNRLYKPVISCFQICRFFISVHVYIRRFSKSCYTIQTMGKSKNGIYVMELAVNYTHAKFQKKIIERFYGTA